MASYPRNFKVVNWYHGVYNGLGDKLEDDLILLIVYLLPARRRDASIWGSTVRVIPDLL